MIALHAMDRNLLQTALRVLQQINKKLPVTPEDEAVLRRNAAPTHVKLALDLIACEIIQREVKKSR
jgi:hypothetical protein